MSTSPLASIASDDRPTPDYLGTGYAPLRRGRARVLSIRGARLVPVADLVDDATFRRYLDSSIRQISPFYARATIREADVHLERIRPLSLVVEKQRYKQARKLVRLMRWRRLRLFEPCLVRYPGETSLRLMLPPVVEQRDSVYVLVDGVHRLTALTRSTSRQKSVRLVVVSGAKLPRPAATPGTLVRVKLSDEDAKRAKKFRKLKPRLFRPAGATLRGDQFRFDSIESFLTACGADASMSQKHAAAF
jgi:hypothetical protein